MKAVTLSAAFILVAALTGCGGSSQPHISGSRVGPFVLTLSQSANTVSSFHQHDGGTISPIGSAATGNAPSALLIESPETFQHNVFVTDAGSNNLTVFNLDSTTGALTPTASSVNTGTNPVALALLEGLPSPPAPPIIYVLNQGSSSISAFRLNDETGGHLSEITGSPFPTQANPQAFTIANVSAPGSSSSFVYVANGTQGTISAFQIKSDGSLAEIAGSPFAVGGNISSVTAPDINLGSVNFGGSLLYASDAANNTVLGFKVQSSGALTAINGSPFPVGAQPGVLRISISNFLYVANRGAGSISGFKMDPGTGVLTPIAGTGAIVGSDPSAIVVAVGIVYVANRGSNSISAFTVDSNTGALSPVSGSPFPVSPSPVALGQLFVMNVD